MTGFEDKVLEKLDNIQALYGYTGLWVAIIAVIVGLLIWFFLKTYFEKNAESFFKKSLTKYQSELIEKIGEKFLEQKRDIDKEITNLRGDIDKDISHLQSNLQLITNQKNNFLNQKRDALVEFYSNYTHWLSTIISVAPIDNMTLKNALEISHSYQQKMEEAMMKCEISSGKLDLYIQDNELIQLKQSLFNVTYDLHNNKYLHIFDIRESYLMINKNYMTDAEADHIDQIMDKLDKKERAIYNRLVSQKDKLQAKISTILREILK